MFDVIIKNARIIDGTGNSWFHGEIGVKCGKIAKIAAKIEGETQSLIDACGLVVTPGFVDIHSHSDLTILMDPRGQSKIQQGITTELNGQCGGWAAPLRGEGLKQARDHFAEYGVKRDVNWMSMTGYFEQVEAAHPALNQAILVGHGTVRAAVFGYEQREPSKDELDEMKVLVKESIKAGAFGMSTGLYYAPGSYSKTDEVIELCKTVAELDGIHASHIRDESDYNVGLIASIQEIIDIARATGVSTEIAHLKALGPRQWGKGPQLLEMIETARKDGFDVTFDQYPYPASGTSITGALLPRWAQEGGRAGTLSKMADKNLREKMYNDMCENLLRRGGADRLLISLYPPDATLQGKTLDEVAKSWGLHPIETALRLLEKSDASFVSFVIADEDMQAIMKNPIGMVGTDGYALAADGPLSKGHPHPRSFGTHPEILGKYVREKGWLKLEDAIRKMTSAPAKKIGIWDRGMIREGNWADIVIFDPATIAAGATFAEPNKYPTGIKYVIVNGTIAVKDGVHQCKFPGMVLKKKC